MNIYEKLPPSKRKTLIKCKECGKEILVRNDYLQKHSGLCISCNNKKLHTNNKYALKHGQYKTRIHRIWRGMKNRCLNKNNANYENYGGRGITVCDEWQNKENGFINFYNWAIQNGYNDNLSIDRIDNQEGYYPENCQWITFQENSGKDKLVYKPLEERINLYNRRITENKTQREFAKELGVSRNTIQRNEKIVKEILRYEHI